MRKVLEVFLFFRQSNTSVKVQLHLYTFQYIIYFEQNLFVELYFNSSFIKEESLYQIISYFR